MTLYHGSNMIVEKPRLIQQSRTLDFGIVLGPVANDTIYRTFAAYEDGILTKEETVSRLKVKKLYNQMTFSTEKALETLRFVGTLDGEEANHE